MPEQIVGRLGGHQAGAAAGMGYEFLWIAALVAFAAAAQISYEAALSRVCTSCAWFVPGLTVCGGSGRRSEGVPT